ncbi:DUF418 domain-containing protein [Lentimicrobium sp.]|uniref:DUF418 domain-containing protein n=2 Tax=Lentimicrobium sp. TaxID=2034841 RepID=UPI0025F6EB3D|nr:DUF418 domain-containing protein [Lentimicrobium sp.]MCO5255490.1 DUF418 domain-containing protein [Lentimicrobium sp.]MCO5263097.1 DUF418 domain-containing protein [Lentimicrobium sp.]HOP12355.1 DUF418 domain-containing protein [Lentimicrobium sp.]HPF65609.1 DUF418 domain-containing protein [Lentimicrobium sp.]HPJ63151.1 DUF418 domain-containing protein [Lentimicrobium sp.]
MKNIASPLPASERIILLDILRGFALLGILMVNMKLFIHPMSAMMLKPPADQPLMVLIPELLVKFLFEGKFYILFSLLFGYGFRIFMQKTAESGSILPVFRRRLLILLIFGILHIVLLWAGDILFFYAIFGFLLILFRNSSDRKVVIWAVVLMLIPAFITAISWGMMALGASFPEGKAAIDASLAESSRSINDLIDRAREAYSQGSFGDIVRTRIEEWTFLLPALLFFYPAVLGTFLFGMLAARKQLAVSNTANTSFFRKSLPYTLPIGIVAEAVYTYASLHADMAVPNGISTLASFSHAVGSPALTFSYIGLIVILIDKGSLSGFWNILVPAGRMALTNYLMQSLICTTIFLSYGLGLSGQLNAIQGIILVMLIFSLQLLFSRYWMREFRYGPVEWLWRRLTYLRPLSFRKKNG